MVGTSNLVLLVATGVVQEHPADQVMMWDSKQQRVLLKIDMNEPVVSLAYTNAEMYLVGMQYTATACSLYDGAVHTWPTCANPRGIHAVSHNTLKFCLATLAKE